MTSLGYADLCASLSDFIQSRPLSGIRFLYFSPADLSKPLVNANLGKWKVKNTWCYIAPGTANYCYIYRESHLKYMVNLHAAPTGRPKSRLRAIPASFSTASGVEANHGDHLTFGLTRGIRGETYIDTHWTIYTEYPDRLFTFDRDSTIGCRVVNVPYHSGIRQETFGELQCYRKPTKMKDEYMYDPFAVNIIYNIYKVIHRPRSQTSPSPPSSPGGAIRLPRRRRRGRRIGGAVSYKGITFISDAFTTFLSEKLFRPVYSLRPNLTSVQVLFDELSELGEGMNDRIVVLYDFEDNARHRFDIDMATALAAAYAAEHPETATAEERAALGRVVGRVERPVTGLLATIAGGTVR